MDIVLVLDLSGSVSSVQNITMQFAYEVAMGLPIDSDLARVAVIVYADNPDICFYLDSFNSKRGVLNALVAKFSGGKTGTESAIRTMYQDVFSSARGDRTGVDNVAVVVSDGGSNIDNERTIPEANRAKQGGITIFSVAIGERPYMGEMEGMASTPTSEHTIRLASPADVSSAAADLLGKLCR